jgi:hypothetical protein
MCGGPSLILSPRNPSLFRDDCCKACTFTAVVLEKSVVDLDDIRESLDHDEPDESVDSKEFFLDTLQRE